MAQSYPGLFNGFVIGRPTMNWNTFIIGEAWPAVVVNQLLGSAGLPPAKSDAANAAALAACGTGGVIADPPDRLTGPGGEGLQRPTTSKFGGSWIGYHAQASLVPR